MNRLIQHALPCFDWAGRDFREALSPARLSKVFRSDKIYSFDTNI